MLLLLGQGGERDGWSMRYYWYQWIMKVKWETWCDVDQGYFPNRLNSHCRKWKIKSKRWRSETYSGEFDWCCS